MPMLVSSRRMTLSTVEPNRELAEGLEEKSIALNTPSHAERFPKFTKAFEEDRLKILFEWENSKAFDQSTEKKRKIKAYLASRDGFFCTIDKLPFSDFGEMDIYHINDQRTDWHRWNLCLASHGCNAQVNAKRFNEQRRKALQYPAPSLTQLSEQRERITGALAHRQEYSAGEGKKHDLFRSLWDNWIPELFHGQLPEENKRLGISINAKIKTIPLDDLADLAVTGLARYYAKTQNQYVDNIGTAQTFKKFIYEDRFGKLRVSSDAKTGIDYVSLRELEE